MLNSGKENGSTDPRWEIRDLEEGEVISEGTKQFCTSGTKNTTTARNTKPRKSAAVQKEEKTQIKGSSNT